MYLENYFFHLGLKIVNLFSVVVCRIHAFLSVIQKWLLATKSCKSHVVFFVTSPSGIFALSIFSTQKSETVFLSSTVVLMPDLRTLKNTIALIGS